MSKKLDDQTSATQRSKVVGKVVFQVLAECNVIDTSVSPLELADVIGKSLQDLFNDTSFKLREVAIEEIHCEKSVLGDKVAFIVLTSVGSDEAYKEFQSLVNNIKSSSLWTVSRALILDSAEDGTKGQVRGRLEDKAQRSELTGQTIVTARKLTAS